VPEEWKKKRRICVVVPASLKGNFRTELRSLCAGNEYLTKKQRKLLKELHPSSSEYKQIIIESDKKIDHYFITLSERLFWKNRYEIMAHKKVRDKRKISAWDYQSTFSIWMKDGVSIMPQSNLITNIGFGVDSTHTFSNKLQFKNESILPIIYNNNIEIDHEADQLFYKNIIYKPLWKYPLLWIKTWLENII
jgi:hypothetical protein